MDPRDRELYEDQSARMPAGSDRPRHLGKLVGAYDVTDKKVYKFYLIDVRFDEQENADLTIDVSPDVVYALDVSGGTQAGDANSPQYAILRPLQNDRWGFTRAEPPGNKLRIYVIGNGKGFDPGAGDGTRFHVTVWKTDGHTTGDIISEGDCTDVTTPNPIVLYPFTGKRGFARSYTDGKGDGYVAGVYDPDISEAGWYSYKIEDKKGSYLYYQSIIDLYFNPANTVGYSYDSDDKLCFVASFFISAFPVLLIDIHNWVNCGGKPISGVEVKLLNTYNVTVPGALVSYFDDPIVTGADGIAMIRNFPSTDDPHPMLSWTATGYDPAFGLTPPNPFISPTQILLCKNSDNYTKTTDSPNPYWCVPRKLYLTFWATGVCPDPPFADCATVDISTMVGGWVGETVELDFVGHFGSVLYGTGPSYISRCRNNMQFLPPPVGRQSSVIRIGFQPGSTVLYAFGGSGIIAKLPVGVDCSTDNLWQGGGFGFSLESVCNPDGSRPTSGKIMYANDQLAGQAFGYGCIVYIYFVNYTRIGIFDMQIGVWSE